MDAHSIDILKYIAEIETPSAMIQGYSNASASGTMYISKLASPVAERSDIVSLESTYEQTIKFSAVRPQRSLSQEEDRAMRIALESSSRLVSKGRVVR